MWWGALIALLVFVPKVAFGAEELIVKLKDGVSSERIFGLDAQYMKPIQGSKNTFVVKGDLESLKKNPIVQYAEPNYKLHALAVKEEIDAQAWGVAKIQADKTQKEGFTGKDVVVAVIDTGVDYTHPALKDKMWKNEKEIPGNGIDDDHNGFVDDVYGYNFYAKNGDPKDDNSHGTHCSGTIAGDKIGVAPGVKIMAVKFLSGDGSGTLADAVEAINYAHKMGADVMSNSWGGGGFSQTMYDAIKEAGKDGVIFVAAAGNESGNNDEEPAYPASYVLPNVISVAAMDKDDKLAYFSNFGESVQLAAPGVDIYSSVLDGKYAVYSGTSMACPHVSGSVALMLEAGYDKSKIKEVLMKTSDKIEGLPVASKGRVNIYRGVHNLRLKDAK